MSVPLLFHFLVSERLFCPYALIGRGSAYGFVPSSKLSWNCSGFANVTLPRRPDDRPRALGLTSTHRPRSGDSARVSLTWKRRLSQGIASKARRGSTTTLPTEAGPAGASAPTKPGHSERSRCILRSNSRAASAAAACRPRSSMTATGSIPRSPNRLNAFEQARSSSCRALAFIGLAFGWHLPARGSGALACQVHPGGFRHGDPV